MTTDYWLQAWTLATDFLHPRDLNDPKANKDWGVFVAVYCLCSTQPKHTQT